MFRPEFAVATSQRFEAATVLLMLLVLTVGAGRCCGFRAGGPRRNVSELRSSRTACV
jgi:hypothetical protein